MSSTAGDLSHLHPSAQASALLADEERLQVVRSDRWIGYPRATHALGRLEQLLNWPRKQRMPNLLLAGPTNSGKSMIVEKFRRDAARREAERHQGRRGAPATPVVVMQMPAEPSPTRFYAALLEASGAPSEHLSARPRVTDLERIASWWLSGNGLQVLVIDELHNVLAGSAARRREFLNLLRYLGNQRRVSLVGVGTQDAYLAIRSDDQLENRFEPVVLPLWRADEPDTLPLLASFAAAFPLRRPSPIATPAMAGYLIERSEGTIGELATLLAAAAVLAITSGEEAEVLTQVDYLGPTQRRRAFERAFR